MSKEPIFYMMVGLPASGKSSECEKLKAVIRSSDFLRDTLCGNVNDMKHNNEVFTILQSLVRADLYNGVDVVYDATNLKSSYRAEFLSTLKLLNCKKVCVFVDTPISICMERNEARDRTVPKDAMNRIADFLQPPLFSEGWDEIRIIKNWEEDKEDGGDR